MEIIIQSHKGEEKTQELLFQLNFSWQGVWASKSVSVHEPPGKHLCFQLGLDSSGSRASTKVSPQSPAVRGLCAYILQLDVMLTSCVHLAFANRHA